MPVINTVSRISAVSVGGQDFSSQLIHYEAGDSSISESGLISTSGTCKLQATMGYPFNQLDDRVNPNLAKGKRVVASFQDVTIPRGILRVRERQYDPKEKTQTLQIVDILSLLAQDQEKDDKSNACFGKPISVFEAINNYLAAAGAPLLIDNIPGILHVPPQATNYIKVCGELAWSAGYALYVDNQERVRAIKIAFKPGGSTKSFEQILDYSRMSSGEVPASKIIITGSASAITRRGNGYGLKIYSEGLDRRSVLIDRFAGLRRTVRQDVWEKTDKIMGWYFEDQSYLIQSEQKDEEYEYDAIALFDRRQHEGENCEDGIQKVLRRKIITILRRYGDVLKEWILLHKLDKHKNPTYTNSFGGETTIFINPMAWVEAEVETTIYDYKFQGAIAPVTPPIEEGFILEEDEQDNQELVVQETITTKQKLAGAIFGKPFKFTKKRQFPPTDLRDFEKETNTWFKQGNEYAHRKIIEVSAAIQNSAAAEALWQQEEAEKIVPLPTTAYTGLVTQEDTITFSAAGNAQPPAPEYAPAEYSIERKNRSFKATIRSPYLDLEFSPPPTTYTIPHVIGNSPAEWQAQAEMMGQNLMGLAWGRYQGVEVTDEIFTGYIPLMPFTLVEDTGIFSYVMDAFTVVLTQTQCMCNYDGLWVGGAGSGSAPGKTTTTSTYSVACSIPIPVGGTAIALSPPLDREIFPGTEIFAGGTATDYAIALASPVAVGSSQIILSSPAPSAIKAGTFLTFGDRQAVVSENVVAGQSTIPVFISPFEIPAIPGSYSQISGGVAVTVSQYVAPGSLSIPIEATDAAINSGNFVWREISVSPIFELIFPIEHELEFDFSIIEPPNPRQLPGETVPLELEFEFGLLLEAEVAELGLEFDFWAGEGTIAEQIQVAELGLELDFGATELVRFSERDRIKFTPASPATMVLKRNSLVVEQIRVVVVEPFSSGWQLSVGDNDILDRFFSTIELQQVATFERNPSHQYFSPTDIIVTIIPGGTGDGTGYVYLREG